MGILTLRVQTLSYSLSSSSTIALVFEWKDPVKLGLSSSLKPIPEPGIIIFKNAPGCIIDHSKPMLFADIS